MLSTGRSTCRIDGRAYGDLSHNAQRKERHKVAVARRRSAKRYGHCSAAYRGKTPPLCGRRHIRRAHRVQPPSALEEWQEDYLGMKVDDLTVEDLRAEGVVIDDETLKNLKDGDELYPEGTHWPLETLEALLDEMESLNPEEVSDEQNDNYLESLGILLRMLNGAPAVYGEETKEELDKIMSDTLEEYHSLTIDPDKPFDEESPENIEKFERAKELEDTISGVLAQYRKFELDDDERDESYPSDEQEDLILEQMNDELEELGGERVYIEDPAEVKDLFDMKDDLDREVERLKLEDEMVEKMDRVMTYVENLQSMAIDVPVPGMPDNEGGITLAEDITYGAPTNACFAEANIDADIDTVFKLARDPTRLIEYCEFMRGFFQDEFHPGHWHFTIHYRLHTLPMMEIAGVGAITEEVEPMEEDGVRKAFFRFASDKAPLVPALNGPEHHFFGLPLVGFVMFEEREPGTTNAYLELAFDTPQYIKMHETNPKALERNVQFFLQRYMKLFKKMVESGSPSVISEARKAFNTTVKTVPLAHHLFYSSPTPEQIAAMAEEPEEDPEAADSDDEAEPQRFIPSEGEGDVDAEAEIANLLAMDEEIKQTLATLGQESGSPDAEERMESLKAYWDSLGVRAKLEELQNRDVDGDAFVADEEAAQEMEAARKRAAEREIRRGGVEWSSEGNKEMWVAQGRAVEEDEEDEYDDADEDYADIDLDEDLSQDFDVDTDEV